MKQDLYNTPPLFQWGLSVHSSTKWRLPGITRGTPIVLVAYQLPPPHHCCLDDKHNKHKAATAVHR